jgi:hypothetical protein
MGFLKKFFRNVYHENAPPTPGNTFDNVSEEQLEAHLNVARYGSFTLSDAVRPSLALDVVPSAGFRHDTYRDDATKQNVPVIMAAASRERLFDTFMEMLDPLGSVVDVVLESSHNYAATGHQDLYREHIDMPILQSILWDFEELLVNDGCAGIAVLNPRTPQEVQFDEHKLLIVYGRDLRQYEQILADCGVPSRDDMRFITEAEHVHSTNDDFIGQFEELKMRLGIESDY